MAYTHIYPAYNNTPNRQLPMGTSPHSPWLDRLRGSTRARVLLSLLFLRLLGYSCVLFRCRRAPDRKPTRSRTPGCTWRHRYCAGPPETDEGDRCLHDAQQDFTESTKHDMYAMNMHMRQTQKNTRDDNKGASPIYHRPGDVSEAPRALCLCNSIGAADKAMERKT